MTNTQDSGTTCPVCGHSNDADSRFCNSCGNRIDGVCPSCSTENRAGSHFCRNCGYDMTVGVQPEAAPQPAADEQPWTGDDPTVVPQPAIADLRAAPPQPGARLASEPSVACPRCQHINDDRSQYCFNCGLPLEGEAGFVRKGLAGIPAYAIGAPAGFWVRGAAIMIDGLVLAGLIIVTVGLFTDVPVVEWMAGDADSGTADLINLVISFAYAPILVGLWATTVGKRALGMRIVRADGSRVGFLRAFGRELARILSIITLFAGYLMVAFREDKRALHDLIADTVVIRVGP